jgi:hypothetical protein
MLRGLSLTQPWATAVANEIKHWETRSWATSFRGEVAIHAAKDFPRWAKEFAAEERLEVIALPLGAIVCLAEIVECRQTETALDEISSEEEKWGDYSDGRFCFRLANVRKLSQPAYVKGALGLWHVPGDIEAQVRNLARP